MITTHNNNIINNIFFQELIDHFLNLGILFNYQEWPSRMYTSNIICTPQSQLQSESRMGDAVLT